MSPGPADKLAAALEELRLLQEGGARVFASNRLSRLARERLVKHGFLQEVMRGWVLSASPRALPGDTTPWFASFWEFCARYCDDRFGAAWHLSPEQSLLLHAERTAIPTQVVIHSPLAGNNRVDLMFGTSYFALRTKVMPPDRDLEMRDGVRVFGIAAALVRVHEDFLQRHPLETAIAAGSVRDPDELLSRLLAGGHTTIAGRLATRFRQLGRAAIADEIVAAMKAAGHDIREGAREAEPASTRPVPSAPPIVARLRLLWATARETVLDELPAARPVDPDAYLQTLDEVYSLDAYHSLSIEGYRVTPDLVERVATGDWDPELVAADREDRNALAARGYWLAYQRVRAAVSRVLRGEADRAILRTEYRAWYREMFAPHVAAGLLDAKALAGHRSAPVYIRASRHVPPRAELLADAMAALFELVEQEPSPVVSAVLGHWLFGYVHPFPDGNGRIARFLMNTLLAAGGAPWTVIRVEDRVEYLEALEQASVDGDVRPFARFVARQMAAAPERSTSAVRPG